jgi:DNA-binding MarR family transcriptional regulator
MAYEDDALERMHRIMTEGRSAMVENMNRVHRGEPAVMRELAVKGERTPSQLADATGNSAGRISAILSSLEKKGWATRTIDPENRRKVIVRITPEGLRLVNLHKKAMDDRVRWVFGQMGRRRTEEFLSLFEAMMTYMSLCGPGQPVPDEDEIRAAFERNGIPYEPAEDRETVLPDDVDDELIMHRCGQEGDVAEDGAADDGAAKKNDTVMNPGKDQS